MAVFNSTYDEEHRWLLLPSIYEIFAKLWEFNLSFVCHKFLWLCQKFLSFPKLCIISLNRIYSFINTLRNCWFLGLWGDFLLKGGWDNSVLNRVGGVHAWFVGFMVIWCGMVRAGGIHQHRIKVVSSFSSLSLNLTSIALIVFTC